METYVFTNVNMIDCRGLQSYKSKVCFIRLVIQLYSVKICFNYIENYFRIENILNFIYKHYLKIKITITFETELRGTGVSI